MNQTSPELSFEHRVEPPRAEVLPKAEAQEVIDELEGVLQRIPRNKEDFRLTRAETQARKDTPKTRYALGSLTAMTKYIQNGIELLKEFHWNINDLQQQKDQLFQGFVIKNTDGSEKVIQGIDGITERKNALTQELLQQIPDSLAEEIGCERVFLPGMIIQMDVQTAAESMAKKRGLILKQGSEEAVQLQEEAEKKFLAWHQDYRKKLQDHETGGMVSDELVDAVEQLIKRVIVRVQAAM